MTDPAFLKQEFDRLMSKALLVYFPSPPPQEADVERSAQETYRTYRGMGKEITLDQARQWNEITVFGFDMTTEVRLYFPNAQDAQRAMFLYNELFTKPAIEKALKAQRGDFTLVVEGPDESPQGIGYSVRSPTFGAAAHATGALSSRTLVSAEEVGEVITGERPFEELTRLPPDVGGHYIYVRNNLIDSTAADMLAADYGQKAAATLKFGPEEDREACNRLIAVELARLMRRQRGE